MPWPPTWGSRGIVVWRFCCCGLWAVVAAVAVMECALLDRWQGGQALLVVCHVAEMGAVAAKYHRP